MNITATGLTPNKTNKKTVPRDAMLSSWHLFERAAWTENELKKKMISTLAATPQHLLPSSTQVPRWRCLNKNSLPGRRNGAPSPPEQRLHSEGCHSLITRAIKTPTIALQNGGICPRADVLVCALLRSGRARPPPTSVHRFRR